MRIEFGHLQLGDIAKANIQECINNGWLTLGPKTKEYESAFAKLFNYKHAVAVNSGTSACMAACMSLYESYKSNRRTMILPSHPNDGIIVPALSFIATSNAVRAAGFRPLWADVDIDTMNISIDSIIKILRSDTPNIEAIMVVNTMGKPCNMYELRKICDEWNLTLICDNCEGYGCQFGSQFMLNYADMETASCYVAHIISSTEGGMVFTNKSDRDYVLRSIRSHGREPDNPYFQHDMFGLNFKPTDLTSAIGLEGTSKFWEVFNTRRKNYKYLYDNLQELKEIAWLVEETPGDVNCAHAFSITFKPTHNHLIDALKNILTENSINWKRNFGCIPTQHRAFKHSSWGLFNKYPNAEYIGNYGLHFGCHQYLTQEDLDYIVSIIKDFMADYV
jgi:dTDP-4-amino-4,6-dideoxygalactose transaminase